MKPLQSVVAHVSRPTPRGKTQLYTLLVCVWQVSEGAEPNGLYLARIIFRFYVPAICSKALVFEGYTAPEHEGSA